MAFVSTYPPDKGNLAEYGSYLSQALAQLPSVAEVHVLANRVPGAPEQEQRGSKLWIHRVWTLGSTPSVEGLVYHAKKLDPDIVHLNAGIRTWGKGRAVSMAGAGLAAVMRLAGLRVVTTLHTIADTVRLDTMGLDWLTIAGMKVASWLYLKADAVTVTLPSMQKALERQFGASNVAYVAHGTYGPRVAAPDLPKAFRVLTFGFWGALKDAHLLVRAVKALREQGLDAELTLAGGAHPYFPEIYRRIVDECRDFPFVHFTGYVPEEELSALFTQASVVVLPYRTNAGASGVLNLCRSYARPVLLSNEDALLEQVRYEGGEALVFNSEAALVEALAYLFNHPDAANRMGQANLEIAKSVTLDTQAERFVEVYRSVLQSKPLPDMFHSTPMQESVAPLSSDRKYWKVPPLPNSDGP